MARVSGTATGGRDGSRAARALADAGALGPFFSVEPAVPAGADTWEPLPLLLSTRQAVEQRVEWTRRRLAAAGGLDPGAVEPRVAASLTALGVTARLISPVLGAALVGGVVPVVAADGWSLGPPRGGPVRVVARPVDGVPTPTPASLAAALEEHCIAPVVLPLVHAVGRPSGVSTKVLLGNVISAVAGAAGMVGRQRPDLARPAGEVVSRLLVHGLLARTGTWAPAGRPPGSSLTRNSCCLLYRLPGAAPCGDCVL